MPGPTYIVTVSDRTGPLDVVTLTGRSRALAVHDAKIKVAADYGRDPTHLRTKVKVDRNGRKRHPAAAH